MTAVPRTNAIEVTTGSRLHFGLTRVAPDPAGNFGGIGVMIEQPATRLRIAPAESLKFSGSERVEAYARQWAEFRRLPLERVHIELAESPPAHSGFGSGTQLAHVTATALSEYFESTRPESDVVASQLNRGQRSMIGSFGFAHGGLIVDDVRRADTTPCLRKHLEMPSDWTAVLVLDSHARKTFGQRERSAFDKLNNDADKAQRLENLIRIAILPAVKKRNFEAFSLAIEEYGKLSGDYYAAVQGGTYNGPVITEIVSTIRRLGGTGVGQSSWGPVVFSWCPDKPSAESFTTRLRSVMGPAVEIWLSPVRNQPALVQSTALAPTEAR
ncbi:MAG: hypothetical protein ACR2NP_14820 [Pirellulaceae bacterium]